jgi:hypothetical protein
MRAAFQSCVVVLAAAGLLSCGAAKPLKAMVAKEQWEAACKHLYQGKLEGRGRDPEDLSEHDVASALGKRAPVRVHMRALAPAEVEKRIGVLSGPVMRLVPFDPRLLAAIPDLSRSPPDDLFEREWMVLEVTLEVDRSSIASAGMGGVDIRKRAFVSAAPGRAWMDRWSQQGVWQPWGPTADGTPAEIQLAAHMGLAREGEQSGPSSEAQARKASERERAAVRELLGLVSTPPCGKVAPGTSCTHRILMRGGGPIRGNAIQIPVYHLVNGPGPGGCSLGRSHYASLSPARTVREQLEGLFGSKGRSLDDLEAMAAAFRRATDPDACREDPSSCRALAACLAGVACSLEGRCQSQGGACVAREVDCENTTACQTDGHCTVKDGACAPPAWASEGCVQACAWRGGCTKSGDQCWSTAPEHCANSIACKRFGACQVDAHACVPRSSNDCAASEACRERGWCSFQENKCLAASDADCAGATVCRSWGACRAAGGLCVSAAAQ